MRGVSVAGAARAFGGWRNGWSRSMGASAGGVTYGGVTVYPASFQHRALAEIMGGMMWSWLFIRCYHDGEAMLFGHADHLDHELHELMHGEGHGEHH